MSRCSISILPLKFPNEIELLNVPFTVCLIAARSLVIFILQSIALFYSLEFIQQKQIHNFYIQRSRKIGNLLIYRNNHYWLTAIKYTSKESFTPTNFFFKLKNQKDYNSINVR